MQQHNPAVLVVVQEMPPSQPLVRPPEDGAAAGLERVGSGGPAVPQGGDAVPGHLADGHGETGDEEVDHHDADGEGVEHVRDEQDVQVADVVGGEVHQV